MKLSRKKENRVRMLRNLATSLILAEKVQTTQAKAKAVLPVVKKLLSAARQNDLTSRRQAVKIIYQPKAFKKLFNDISRRLLESTPAKNIKIVRLDNRLGDNASMVQISLSLRRIEEILQEKDNTIIEGK